MTKQEKEGFIKTGKYLTFKLGNEEYGLEIIRVTEIIGLMEITPVPRTPDYIRGVINLRGKVIPIVNLRRKFAMEDAEDTEITCIIVVDVQINGDIVQMGIVVDSVSEVLDIREDEIEDTPSFGSEFDANFILGIAMKNNAVKILLDIDMVLSSQGLLEIKDFIPEEVGSTSNSRQQ